VSHFVLTVERKGEVVASRAFSNTITKEGAAHALDIWVDKNTSDRNWYAGLISSGLPTLASTAATPGFTEFTGYDETLRRSNGTFSAISNSGLGGTATFPCLHLEQFTVNAPSSISGAFWSTDSTKGGTGGKLWGGGVFSPVSVVADDVITLTYTLVVQADDSFGAP
jgi:hypothetical protein